MSTQSSPDLTTALIALSSAAKGRRVARKALREATDVVADAIREHLRAWDEVALDGHTVVAIDLTWACRQCEGAGTVLHPGGVEMLLVDDCYLGTLARESYWDGHNRQHPIAGDTLHAHDGAPYKPAGADTRLWFAGAAAAIIDAFRELLAGQGRSYGEAAEAVTKVVPR